MIFYSFWKNDRHAFIDAPSQELLDLTKNSDLLDIAAHFDLTTVNKSMLKQEIGNILVQFLVDKKILLLCSCSRFTYGFTNARA